MDSDLRKPKSARGKRAVEKRESKIVENEKSAIFLRSTNASAIVRSALVDLCTLKKPFAKLLQHKNPIHPFDDANSLEFLTRVNDSSLFVLGSDSKKRPHSLTFGRTFDFQILDMMEFQLDPKTFKTIQDLSSGRSSSARLGAKPMMVFTGESFDTSEDMKAFKSLMLDFYRGVELQKVNLAGLDRLMVFNAAVNPQDLTKKIIYIRNYSVLKKKSGTRFPKIQLEELGPRIDLAFNRRTEGSTEIRKESMRIHKAAKAAKRKNVEIGQMGALLGRVHMEKQNLNELALAKLKGLGKRNGSKKRMRDESDGSENLTDDFAKADPQTKKKSRGLPKAYSESIISE